MTALLAACLLLLSDDAPRDSHHESSAAETSAERVHQRTIKAFTDLLESEDTPLGLRKHLLVRRAAAWLGSGEAAKAIEDCNAALQLDPKYASAYALRAAAFEMQGYADFAQADRKVAELLASGKEEYYSDDGYGPDGEYYHRVYPWELVPIPAWQFNPGLLLAELWVLVAVGYLALGWEQRVQGGGSIRRWLWVSVAAATLAVAPYGVWALGASVLGLDQPGHGLAWAAAGASVIFVALSLRPPVSLLHSKRLLHLVEDETLLARVRQVAEKMQIAPPRVRLLLSTSAVMEAQAFAGGLPAPSLVVTDGVLHRLAPAERDGIVAHEMAHVANRSLWLFAMIAPVSCIAGLLAGTVSPVPVFVGLAVFMGLRRIVNRLVEPDCDRRAADAIGYREMASALAKVHAVNPIPRKGFLSALIYATATHPPHDVRLAALARRAPPHDRPEAKASLVRIRWHRVLTWAALLTWVTALASPVIAARWYPDWAVGTAIPLLLVAFSPLILLGLGLRRHMRRASRRLGGEQMGSVGWVRVIVVFVVLFIAGVALAVGTMFSLFDEELVGTALFPAVTVILAIVFLLWPNKAAKLQRKVAVALQLHDFQQVVELERTAPAVFARNPILRHNFAVAAGLSGDRERAIAELEGLRRDKPKFKVPWLVLAAFYLDGGQPERTLEIAIEAARQLKHDPVPHGLAAQALRRLGRLDEAQQAVDRALAIEPEAGDGHAIAAALALDRGDSPRATELIEKAQELAPGDASVLVAQAEIALATEPLETARSAVEQALKAAQANPFAMLSFETSALQARLAEQETQQKAERAEISSGDDA